MTWRHQEPCGHVTDRTVCARPDTRAYLPGWRCPDHTPAALAGRPETTPDPDGTLAALRARAGIPTDFAPPAAETVIDQKAIASGKRRSSVTRYREAQEATR